MHEHDLDLIAEYAGGSLSDGAEAARLVASCERCANEFAAHRAVLEALGSLPSVALNEFERARLHRGVLAAIGDDTPVAVRVIERSARVGWWDRLGLRVAAVAAVGVVGVGLVGVLSRMSSPDQLTDTVAAELAPGGEAEAPTTTMASASDMAGLAASDTEEARLESRTRPVVDLGEVERSVLSQAIEEQQAILMERAHGDDGGATVEAPEAATTDEFADPLNQCQVDPGVVLVIVAQVDGRPIAVPFDQAGLPSPVWTDTCEVADIG